MAGEVVLYIFLALPALIGLRALQQLQKSITEPKYRMRAICELPIILIVAPLFITGVMMAEAHFDDQFLARSFVNAEAIGPTDLLLFAYDQAMRGSFFDVAEVFLISLTPIQHKCDSVLFCVSLFIYRTSVGLAASTFLLAVVMSVSGRFTRDKENTSAKADSA